MTVTAAQRSRLPGSREVAPGVGSVAITAADADLELPIRQLYVTTAGDVTFTAVNGTTDTWTVPNNYMIPVAMKRVSSTGTTALGLHGIY